MHPVSLVELLSIGVLGLFLIREIKLGRLRELAPLALTLVLGAWIAEDTCIRLYGFYQYDPTWSIFLDKMPLMVAFIWPFVILSDREVVEGVLGPEDPRVPIITGAWVVWDVCLMEAVCVSAGLWSWNEPGFFGVPVIGVLGWGYFTGAALWLWGALPRPYRLLTVLLAPIVTHGLVLLTWWGGLRWVLRGEISPEVAVLAGGIVGLGLSLMVWRRSISIGLRIMGPRIPAALVFILLLLVYRGDNLHLMAFAATFIPPYLIATHWRGGLSA